MFYNEISQLRTKTYSIYYRSNRVFRDGSQWYFEDDASKQFGPFPTKVSAMKAVRIYIDIKANGVDYRIDKIQKIMNQSA